ncbi:histone-lysine N-methyltransferase SMYD3 [Maniola hyperantus]|uniref:histone-lysine N-methyltransferase SMYD3 n=1 Tax=Aphantopus hyperantus TaxID=2795564 RepID=UPI0015694D8A|nr:histone-lysine N-methyltransferase SMYD3 [Maniola hyperantus]
MKNKFRIDNIAVKAGDLILTEEPFAYVLSSKEKGNRCDNCLKQCKVLKCSACQFVHYCGKNCQRDAWVDHKWECANLKRVSPKVIPDAARMMAKIINRIQRSDGGTHKAYYTATSFRRWKDLMSHYTDLKTDKKRMDHFTSLCGVLYEFLKDISMPNTVELMGLYGRMIINSFTILDIDMNSIGTGIYLASSIIDHSCNPNAVATFDGKTINIRVIKGMPCLDWKKIRISYIDLMKTPWERQSELQRSYYFLCACDRCMDENDLKYVHAAKCLNSECNNPVNISWKKNLVLVKKPEKHEKELENGKSEEKTTTDNVGNEITNEKVLGKKNESTIENAEKCIRKNENAIQNGECEEKTTNGIEDMNINGEIQDKSISCEECGTKFTEKNVEIFIKTMEFSELHLQNMKETSVSYVDICKYCLERQEGVLHPLNVMYAQTLDNAFDALIQVQLWETACGYAEKLVPCFRFYYGNTHPLMGLLHLKYGKILLYKMCLEEALHHFKQAEKILKITHGERHPLYRDHLLPLISQTIIES